MTSFESVCTNSVSISFSVLIRTWWNILVYSYFIRLSMTIFCTSYSEISYYFLPNLDSFRTQWFLYSPASPRKITSNFCFYSPDFRFVLCPAVTFFFPSTFVLSLYDRLLSSSWEQGTRHSTSLVISICFKNEKKAFVSPFSQKMQWVVTNAGTWANSSGYRVFDFELVWNSDVIIFADRSKDLPKNDFSFSLCMNWSDHACFCGL